MSYNLEHRGFASRRSHRGNLKDKSTYSSRHCINRFIVQLHDADTHMDCDHVEFESFDGETYTHLKNFHLYTLTTTGPADAQRKNSNDMSDMIARLSLSRSKNAAKNPANAIVETLQGDLEEMVDKFHSFAFSESSDRSLVPIMWLRLGKLLFHDPRSCFDWENRYTLDGVERSIQCGRMSKTFDTSLPEEEFLLLNEMSHQDALETRKKERIVIEVEDKRKPGQHLWCICPIYECGSPAKTKSYHSRQIPELKKVRLKHTRHMVGDVACVGKRTDIRLVFFMKRYISDLTEEELSELKACLSKASIDNSVKGGLNWHHHNKCSSSGRFEVVGSSFEARTITISRELRWCFQKCNRVDLEPSAARISYEVSIRPVACHESFKGRGEQNAKELVSSIEESLERVWADVI